MKRLWNALTYPENSDSSVKSEEEERGVIKHIASPKWDRDEPVSVTRRTHAALYMEDTHVNPRVSGNELWMEYDEDVRDTLEGMYAGRERDLYPPPRTDPASVVRQNPIQATTDAASRESDDHDTADFDYKQIEEDINAFLQNVQDTSNAEELRDQTEYIVKTYEEKKVKRKYKESRSANAPCNTEHKEKGT